MSTASSGRGNHRVASSCLVKFLRGRTLPQTFRTAVAPNISTLTDFRLMEPGLTFAPESALPRDTACRLPSQMS